MMSRPKAARELIAFYLDAGVDALLGEEPVNRMADEISLLGGNVAHAKASFVVMVVALRASIKETKSLRSRA